MRPVLSQVSRVHPRIDRKSLQVQTSCIWHVHEVIGAVETERLGDFASRIRRRNEGAVVATAGCRSDYRHPGHQATRFSGGGIQRGKGSASAGGLMTRMQVATAIRHVRRANLAVAAISSVFIVGSKAVSHSFPKLCAGVAKKVTGATALCVSQCDATPRPERSGYSRGTISVRARRNKSRHAVRRDG